jgi:hypothetical protein
MNEEKEIERREILLLEKEKKYTVYNYKEETVERYRVNKRQSQKYKGVKFYKGNGAINYLGKRNNKFKGIIIEENKKDE